MGGWRQIFVRPLENSVNVQREVCYGSQVKMCHQRARWECICGPLVSLESIILDVNH